MNILIKSALKENEFADRKQMRENHIEIQLLKDFYNETPTLEEYFNTIINSEVNIDIIHTPLVFGEDVEIDNFCNEKEKNIFLKTCELANMVGFKQDKNILVVVHSSMNFREDMLNQSKIQIIDDVLVNTLKKYKYISIAIENIIPLVINGYGINGRNGFLNDNCLYVEYFINKYGFKERIGTVLDTCHAITTIKLLRYCNINITIEQYFDWNKQYIKLIHLANVGGNGYGKGEHGTGFLTDEDKKVLKEIINLYYKYNYKCPITIEVYEKDYANPINYLGTKENLLKLIKKKNI